MKQTLLGKFLRNAVSNLRALPPSLWRKQLSSEVFPTQGDQAQKIAGRASALVALAGRHLDPDATDVDTSLTIDNVAVDLQITSEDLRTGLRNIRGAIESGGGSNRVNTPDPSVPQDAGVAAFFDVDNTLIKGASILLFARGLATRKYFSPSEIAGFIWMQAKFRLRGKESAGDIASGREQALQLVAGHSEAEIIQLGEEIWANNIADRVFPGTRQLADEHISAGHEVWLVTATPVQLAQIIARELGFTGALGTVAEVVDGKFTGRMVGDILHGEGKKHAVLALAATEGLDIARCTAYSDSVNDLPMLSLVGKAVAVNPDRELRKAAEDRGWEVREWRRSRRAINKGIRTGRGALRSGWSLWESRWESR